MLLENGVELIVIEEPLGSHSGVTATVHVHGRLRLQRDAINVLDTALDCAKTSTPEGDDAPTCATRVR
ncbi:hypothetical protein [Streptomyces sp. NPDC048106]|uniref:hypothetical protein n=1 Tax=Streptomyces sp. NPDC048106 TaxID=3155750 RepID=UPI003453BE38